MAMKTAEALLQRYGSTLVDDPVAYTRIVQRDALEAAAKAVCRSCAFGHPTGDTYCDAQAIHDLKADLEAKL